MVQLTYVFDRFRQPADGGTGKTSLLRDADAARDRREWSTAADLYKQYLEETPDRCAIWIQLGHALKDDKKFGPAIEAYKRALALEPDNFDTYVNLGHAHKDDKNVGLAIEAYKHALTLEPNDFDIYVNLGHAYKMAGDRTSAYEAYRKALELNPACADARREIARLSSTDLSTGLSIGLAAPTGAEAVAPGPTIFLDITDLMEYAKHNNTLSGIQRVVANLILAARQYESSAGLNIVPVVPEYDLLKIHAVDLVVVASLIAAIGRKAREEIDEGVRAVYATRRIVVPQSGDNFTIAGAFWIYESYDVIKHLRANGVRFTLFIHDLIQISHPQYCHEAASKRFRRALVDALMLADLILTNSEYVANDVRRFMSSKLNFSVPVKSVPLATALGQQSQDAPPHPSPRDMQNAMSAPFVLSVGTIEVRKNHMYMIRVWEELIEKGVRNIPNLVFVGKIGWDIEPFMRYIAESDHLGGRLHILTDVSDQDLTTLYERCLFTMFPSFVEGFGLPVGESLAHGKPCITSNRSSTPEVGGRFAKYVIPEDIEGGARLVEELLADPTSIAAWEKEIREHYQPRTWAEFATEYFDNIADQRNPPLSFSNFKCDPGEIYSFGFSAIPERDARKQKLIYCASSVDSNWHFSEDWGVWMAKRRARLQFRTPYAPGDLVAVYMELQLPAGTAPSVARFSILSGGEPVDLCHFERERQWFVFEVVVGAINEVEIELVAMGEYKVPEDTRQLFLGARRLCCCKAGDYGARIRVVEKLTFLGN